MNQLVDAADLPLAMKLLHAIIAEGLFAEGGLVDAFGTTIWFYDQTPDPHVPVGLLRGRREPDGRFTRTTG